MQIKQFLCTTAIVLALTATAPAFASDGKLVDILTTNHKDVTTETLNQAMLDLMQGRDNAGSNTRQEKPQQCSPDKPFAFDDPNTDVNECNIANIAPAAGDDGGDEPAADDSADNTPNDELNDPEPPTDDPPQSEEPPPSEDPPPSEEPPTEEQPPVDDYPGSYVPPSNDTVSLLSLPTEDMLRIG